jgi:hypothetical protein
LSVLIVTIGTCTFPFPPEQIENPLFILHLPLVMKGAFSQNMAAFLPSCVPLLAFYFLLLVTAIVIMRNATPLLQVFSGTLIALAILLVGSLASAAPSGFDYFARGSVLYYLGNYEESEQDLRRALAQKPDDHLMLMIQSRLYQIHAKTSKAPQRTR